MNCNVRKILDYLIFSLKLAFIMCLFGYLFYEKPYWFVFVLGMLFLFTGLAKWALSYQQDDDDLSNFIRCGCCSYHIKKFLELEKKVEMVHLTDHCNKERAEIRKEIEYLKSFFHKEL